MRIGCLDRTSEASSVRMACLVWCSAANGGPLERRFWEIIGNTIPIAGQDGIFPEKSVAFLV